MYSRKLSSVTLDCIVPRSFDVSEVARSYGGGGHKNAAAFQIPKNGRTTEETVQDFIKELSEKIDAAEAENVKKLNKRIEKVRKIVNNVDVIDS